MGEFIDTLHGAQKVSRVKENDVFLNYTLKTARYTFDCPLVVGAILAGAGENDIRKLSTGCPGGAGVPDPGRHHRHLRFAEKISENPF